MANRDKVDMELNQLISRLNNVQGKIGGPGKQSVQAVLGEDGLVDRFQELKIQVLRRIEELKELQGGIAEMKAQNAQNRDARERIQSESDHRKMISSIEADIKEMDDMNKTESKKKRSKYTKADLEIRSGEISDIRRKIEDMKEFARRGFSGAREGLTRSNMVDMKDSELFSSNNNNNSNKARLPKEAITTEQLQSMNQIQEKDKQIDKALDEVGRGVDMLKELAIQAGQEAKSHSALLENLEGQMDDVGDKMVTINDQLKVTLEAVRASDKLCMDILCILIMLGLVYVLYKVSSNASEIEEEAAAAV